VLRVEGANPAHIAGSLVILRALIEPSMYDDYLPIRCLPLKSSQETLYQYLGLTMISLFNDFLSSLKILLLHLTLLSW
jgi:hypothetical protein